jgi:hypothetical protein
MNGNRTCRIAAVYKAGAWLPRIVVAQLRHRRKRSPGGSPQRRRCRLRPRHATTSAGRERGQLLAMHQFAAGESATGQSRPGHFGSSLNSGSIVIDPKATRQSDRSFRPFARQAFRRVFSGAAVRAETLISLCRSIQSTHPPLHAQKFRLRRRANQWPLFARPASTRGAYRDRHGRWRQDAMDALAAPDE